MKKTGIALLLVMPLLVAWFGLHAYLAPEWYVSTVMIERGSATFEDVNKAFQEIAPKNPDVTLQNIENTDLVEIRARDLKAQPATDKANAVAAALEQKLPDPGSQFPRIRIGPEPATQPIRFPVLPNILFGAALGLIPAILGLILLILGNRSRLAGPPQTRQIA